MRTRERHKIYKEVLDRVARGWDYFGFCWFLPDELSEFPEIMKHKPRANTFTMTTGY